MGALLEIAGLTRRFGGVTAVDALDLSVSQGELVSIIGPNGAGKTTVVQSRDRTGGPRCRQHHVRAAAHRRSRRRADCCAGPCPHLPARPRVRQSERARQPARRRPHTAQGGAPVLAHHCPARGARAGACAAGRRRAGGDRAARRGHADPGAVRRSSRPPRRQSGVQPVLRQPPAPGDRAGALPASPATAAR